MCEHVNPRSVKRWTLRWKMGTRFNKRCYVRKKTKGCLSIQIYIFVPTKNVYIVFFVNVSDGMLFR